MRRSIISLPYSDSLSVLHPPSPHRRLLSSVYHLPSVCLPVSPQRDVTEAEEEEDEEDVEGEEGVGRG